ncbi:proliferating cell nuclear antigen [Thecamonas trahens ATCC 50062]|uniref:DNA sliding clamp PCNA n=1 Tax=Thecamonas trahens ATCC 50062 TaxID=461836 RepID=A0A0L0DHB6_THETB|nr:proliferating cell nuclear antigen [Thecamonas trahens ATCC 50062]KNC51754.1 proliferating cell nuclear antigen [Thecamonas trahens ATCC 50062]|eukprot:XP_013755882.1 proliferating cell nuclear antigen [Thecamonas trahens ATCC 50062]
MFEARLPQGDLLKKILEAVKDLVTDANFDCSSTGISLQAMDSSHVSLVSLLMRADGFDHFRCDRNISIGLNLLAMSKVVRCVGNNDAVTMKADDNGDLVTLMFESQDGSKVSDWQLRGLDIDSERLGIPSTDYSSVVTMPSAEFARICRDLSVIGDTVVITTTKEGVTFASKGELGTGKIALRQSAAIDDDADSPGVSIELQEPVSQSFALRYLSFFTKATPLAPTVTISMSNGVPLVVEYPVGDMGHIRFYLAPKVEDDA